MNIISSITENDELGRTILNELGKKAEQGVEVKILYDDMGSRGLRNNFSMVSIVHTQVN
jgi:phosphatidylserine/phosphatidylglycerophosphate/cardiolipin synthase-like enzyme